MNHGHEICSGCGQEMDPAVCWCGDEMESHPRFEHEPVPMGCDCSREAEGDVAEVIERALGGSF